MPGQAKRHYSNIEDHAMLEKCQTMHDLFEDNLADFENFDSDFAGLYKALWQEAIDLAESFPSDTTTLYRISQATAAVEMLMKLCCKKFRKARHFIELAFPGNRGIYNEFGYGDFDMARNNPTRMILFMDRLHSLAMDKNTELIAAGYGQASIDEIKTLHDALNQANCTQEMLKRQRVTTTQTRIKLLNTAWKFMSKTAKAAKLIYKNNYAKYNQYLLAEPSNKGDIAILQADNGNATTIQGSLPDSNDIADGTGIIALPPDSYFGH